MGLDSRCGRRSTVPRIREFEAGHLIAVFTPLRPQLQSHPEQRLRLLGKFDFGTMLGLGRDGDADELRRLLAEERQKCETVKSELQAQCQVNADIFLRLEENKSRLYDEGRLHELTRQKLASARQATTELAGSKAVGVEEMEVMHKANRLLKERLDETVEKLIQLQERGEDIQQDQSLRINAPVSAEEVKISEKNQADGSQRKMPLLSPLDQMEKTVSLLRNELRRALTGEEELKAELDQMKKEMDTLIHERDLILAEKSQLVLQGPGNSHSEKYRDTADGGDQGFEERNSTKEAAPQFVNQKDSSPRSSVRQQIGGICVDFEEHRLLRAKFARISALLEDEQLRRQELETQILNLKPQSKGEQRECLCCMHRANQHDSKREEIESRLVEAKADLLSSRAECARLRADLNHALDCLMSAEQTKILLERALRDQQQRYQSQCETLRLLQTETPIRPMPRITSSSPSSVATPEYHSRAILKQQGVKVSPSLSTPHTSNVSILKQQGVKVSPSLSPPNTSNIGSQTAMIRDRSRTSLRHSRPSADSNLPSLSLPQEMMENPDGVIHSKMDQFTQSLPQSFHDSFRESSRFQPTAKSVVTPNRSSLPPRAREGGDYAKQKLEASKPDSLASESGNAFRRRAALSDGPDMRSTGPLSHSQLSHDQFGVYEGRVDLIYAGKMVEGSATTLRLRSEVHQAAQT